MPLPLPKYHSKAQILPSSRICQQPSSLRCSHQLLVSWLQNRYVPLPREPQAQEQVIRTLGNILCQPCSSHICHIENIVPRYRASNAANKISRKSWPSFGKLQNVLGNHDTRGKSLPASVLARTASASTKVVHQNSSHALTNWHHHLLRDATSPPPMCLTPGRQQGDLVDGRKRVNVLKAQTINLAFLTVCPVRYAPYHGYTVVAYPVKTQIRLLTISAIYYLNLAKKRNISVAYDLF